MSTATLVFAIACIAVGTFALRLSFIGFWRGPSEGGRWQTVLRFVPVSVLLALLTPAIVPPLLDMGVLDAWSAPKLIAAVVAVVIAHKTKNALPTIAGGMITLWSLHWLLSLI